MEGEEGVYVRWEEVVVAPSENGRRVVHYYLRAAGGGARLAVVGREKSVRHMSYVVPGSFRRSLKPEQFPVGSPMCSSSPQHNGMPVRLRSRREVIDWLSALVSDSVSYGSHPMVDRFSDDEDAEPTNTLACKGISSGKMDYPSKEFSWLGSAWNCRKRRKHYRSFCRRGVSISVHDFVYIVDEDKKRLVAYVEDLYEDLRANNMVVVRWFHKVDEVAIVLPPDVNDREIFFSLCLQDFSVECIDGLAAVLSPRDFEKFQSKAWQSTWEPYLCWRQIDNDDIKPFDVTQVQGYWSQELLRSLYTPSLKVRLKINCSGSSLDKKRKGSVSQFGPKKKHLWDNEVVGTGPDTSKSKGLGYASHAERQVQTTNVSSALPRKALLKQKLEHQQLDVGSQVEVLSQDSGIRGCWFRCTILKRHHDKVKVRYEDVQDADDTSKLEEWILASKIAATDKMGIHYFGRPIVRPHPSQRAVGSFNVGTAVDAWWNDGWWEGIVILKESGCNHHVYLAGENQFSIFGEGDLRHSLEWIGNKWSPIKDREDIASSLSCALNCKTKDIFRDGFILQADADPESESLPPYDKVMLETETSDERKSSGDVPNLAKHCQLDGLKWCSSGKRRSPSKGGSACKRQCYGSSSSSSQDEAEEFNSSGCFVLPKSMTVEQEICKLGGDPLLSAPMPLCSSLVMSR